MIPYKLFPKDERTNKDQPFILRKIDNASIPTDLNNTDYQEYLEWVDKGNTAEAAD